MGGKLRFYLCKPNLKIGRPEGRSLVFTAYFHFVMSLIGSKVYYFANLNSCIRTLID